MNSIFSKFQCSGSRFYALAVGGRHGEIRKDVSHSVRHLWRVHHQQICCTTSEIYKQS